MKMTQIPSKGVPFVQSFTTFEMAKLSGLNVRTIQLWATRQHIVPMSGSSAPGKGVRRPYGTQAAFGICVAGMLQHAGFGGEAVAKALRFCATANLRRRIEAGQRYLSISGTTVTLLTADGVAEMSKPDAPIGLRAFLDLARLLKRFVEVTHPATTPDELEPLVARPEELQLCEA